MKPRVTAGLKCPPVNWPPQTIEMKRLSEMKTLEKTPLRRGDTIFILRQASTPYENIAEPVNSKKMILNQSILRTSQFLRRCMSKKLPVSRGQLGSP